VRCRKLKRYSAILYALGLPGCMTGITERRFLPYPKIEAGAAAFKDG
jgi:hypothetical protein